MFRRSTNAVGYTHFLGDVTAQVDSSHGVRLTGGSTGGIVEAVGDDTNVPLTVRAQGTGTLTLGSSGAPVTLGGSTELFRGIVRQTDTAVVVGAMTSTDVGLIETTHTNASLNTNCFVIANSMIPSTIIALVSAYVSDSTGENVHCRWMKASTAASTASTQVVRFLFFRF